MNSLHCVQEEDGLKKDKIESAQLALTLRDKGKGKKKRDKDKKVPVIATQKKLADTEKY